MRNSTLFPLEWHLIRQHRLEMELAYLGVEDEEFVTLAVVGEQTKVQKEESDELGISRRRRATTDEHLTHRPPICCAFCCCVRLEVCQGVCRVACGVCQHPLFVALFRDHDGSSLLVEISLFKIVGIVLAISTSRILRRQQFRRKGCISSSPRFEYHESYCLTITHYSRKHTHGAVLRTGIAVLCLFDTYVFLLAMPCGDSRHYISSVLYSVFVVLL